MKEHQVRGHPELHDYCQMAWTSDLRPWGLVVSQWICPAEWDFQANVPLTDTAVAFLYKHESGAVHVAKSYEQQVEVHKLYGVPVVEAGEEFKQAGKGRQLSIQERSGE